MLRVIAVVVLVGGCTAGEEPQARSEQAASTKVTICHVPAGAPWNAHTIQVSQSAVGAHLEHGDYPGACTPPGQVCTPSSTTACYEGPADTADVGLCIAGIRTCNAGGTGFGACVGQVTPVAETCDSLDNDCDGSVDESCLCVPGSAITCYDGPAGTAGVGACAAGTQTCAASGTSYGVCLGQVQPTAETCGDGVDTDCDGLVDEGCVCSPGSTAACYGGPAGTAGVGVCATGTQTCDATGTGYGACSGDIVPTAEACGDGLDNDCDGVADEDCVCVHDTTESCYTGPAGTNGVGACAAGTRTCNSSGTAWGACTGETTPGAEACGDEVDNDCDGVMDDGCVCIADATTGCYDGPPDTEGVGTCATGAAICNATGTAYGPCLGDILPAAELCGDGLDSDCDGLIDDGCVCTPSTTSSCYSGPPGTAGVGACTVGAQVCNASGTAWGACTGDVVPVAEVCGDSIDNDCDGDVDDGCIGDFTWRDNDQDGSQDLGEPGVAGVVVLLRTSAGALVAVSTSDVAGGYHFGNVPSGSYYIEVVPPVGLGFTVANVGGDTTDSDVDPGTSATDIFTFATTSADATRDCGLVITGT